jgi:glycosyltransferase involved in cell wall biosynthesis
MTDQKENAYSPQERRELSVAIMAYNEEKTLDSVIAEIVAETEKLPVSCEIVIIDDGSTDRTPEISRSWAKKNGGIRVISHPRNLGLGEVYRTGFRNCKGDYLTFFPADEQFSAAIIKDYQAKILRADMVLGYTDIKKRDTVSVLLSKAERFLFRLLVGPLPDFQGIVMFRRELLDRIELKTTGRGQMIMLELILKAYRTGCVIDRQEIAVFPRKKGRSKVNTLLNIWANAVQLIRLRITAD